MSTHHIHGTPRLTSGRNRALNGLTLAAIDRAIDTVKPGIIPCSKMYHPPYTFSSEGS